MALARKLCLLEQAIRKTGGILRTGVRHFSFLPSSYHLDDVWQKRLDSPLMKQIRLEQYYAELRKKFDAEKTGSALDIDIFANAVQRSENLSQLEDLLYCLRNSPNTVETKVSTCNSVVRSFVEMEEFDALIKIISDKAKYGMFLDYYTGNFLMDKLIQLKRISDAARIAIDFMFQEDFGHPVTRELALFSCLSFLKDPDWNLLTPLNLRPPPVDTGEEVLVYVSYIKNAYFDDHFDLTDAKHRIGKTLFIAGQGKDDILGRSAQIIGLGLYEKWNRGVSLLEKFASTSDDCSLTKEAVDSFLLNLKQQVEKQQVEKQQAEKSETAEMKDFVQRVERVQKTLQDGGKLKEENLLTLSERQVVEAVKLNVDADTLKQEKLYGEWMSSRENEVKNQIRRFEINERLRTLQLQRQKLKSEEDLLFFFERKNQWEKMLTPAARQKMADDQLLEGSFYNYRVEDPQYEIEQINTPQTYTPFHKWERGQETYDNKVEEMAPKTPESIAKAAAKPKSLSKRANARSKYKRYDD